jgi:hypothetical protein
LVEGFDSLLSAGFHLAAWLLRWRRLAARIHRAVNLTSKTRSRQWSWIDKGHPGKDSGDQQQALWCAHPASESGNTNVRRINEFL